MFIRVVVVAAAIAATASPNMKKLRRTHDIRGVHAQYLGDQRVSASRKVELILAEQGCDLIE